MGHPQGQPGVGVTRITQEHSQERLCHEMQDGGVKPACGRQGRRPQQVELGLAR
jgi:hypothetical protein